jgi:hypothetical protein
MMKMLTKVIPLMLLILITGCRPNDAVPSAASTASGTIVCEVFYRSTTGAGLESAPEISFSGGTEEQSRTFTNMNFNARFQDDDFEGRALSIAIMDLDNDAEISRQLYQLDPQNPLENQFIGGHGFSGLNYVFHPDTSAEMQYFCSVK